MSSCPYCGWPDDEPAQIVSEHPTGDGATRWTRCWCGSLQMRHVARGGEQRITVRGRPQRAVAG
ncbi:hypothetical protein GCM10009801_46300 [Streptomyces albiaxialis]|uniref:Uncharacterized protein n=1 Tax=Streptomyces albiaxialis TaxID=329523 RepID=A0ABN2W7I0_9ACTN